MKFLGLDVGTTTICGAVVNAADGRVVFLQTEGNAAGIPPRAPWESIQDPDGTVRIARGILAKALEAHQDIGGIGIACQMHGVLYVDGAGNAASPLYTWQDGRGDLPFEGGTYASFVAAAVGWPAATGMGAVTHFANARMGLVPKSAAFLCTIGDYLALKLTVRRTPLLDVTIAASIGGFDLEKLAFARPELRAIGSDPSFFPEVTQTSTVLGELQTTGTGPASERSGMRPRARPGARRTAIPVFPAIGDNQASFLGAIADRKRMALVMVGTGTQISVFLDTFRRREGIDLRPLPFGGYIGVGAGLWGGRAYAALREFFRQTVLAVTGQDAEIPWDVINRMSPPDDTEPLRVDTRFSGTRVTPSIRGSISNIGLSNLTPQHFASGIRDGMVSELLGFYGLLSPSERDGINTLVGSGNAIRRNDSLRRAFEKGFRAPLLVPRPDEETAFGAALMAGVASGVIPDLAAAGSLIRYEEPQSAAR